MSQQAAEAPIVNAWSTKLTVPFFLVGNYAPVFNELRTFDLWAGLRSWLLES